MATTYNYFQSVLYLFLLAQIQTNPISTEYCKVIKCSPRTEMECQRCICMFTDQQYGQKSLYSTILTSHTVQRFQIPSLLLTLLQSIVADAAK